MVSVQTPIALIPSKPFEVEGDVKNKWKHWEQRFSFYMIASESDTKPDNTKKAILLTCVGEEILKIFNTLGKKNVTYDESITALESFFIPKANVMVDRHNFYSKNQAESEDFNSFLNQIK